LIETGPRGFLHRPFAATASSIDLPRENVRDPNAMMRSALGAGLPATFSRRRGALAALAATVAVLGVGTADIAAARAESLLVAVEGEYPPFNVTDKKGRLTGFDVDIANAICKALDASCKLVKQQWDRMIPDLAAGKYDMVVSSMSITSSRRKQIDFTRPYYQTPAKFVAKKGGGIVVSPDGLKGRRLGVQRATSHERYLTSLYGDSAVLVRYDTLPKAQADMVAGKVDLVFADAMALSEGFLKTKKGEDFEFVGPDFRDSRWLGQGIGIGVRRGRADLVGQLNEALDAIKADGTYARIERAYFDFAIGQGQAIASQ
jgi:arginine/ornithine transport system substrate-binding protein